MKSRQFRIKIQRPVAVPLNLLFAILILLLLSPLTCSAKGLCEEPELIEAAQKIDKEEWEKDKKRLAADDNYSRTTFGGPKCQARPLLYRLKGGEVQKAELASVRIGSRDRRKYIQFLRLPDGEIVSLGMFSFSMGLDEPYRSLKFSTGGAGGLARVNPAVFFDPLIEKDADNYCLVYRMKHPFTGELRKCAEKDKPTGVLGFANGVLKLEEARDMLVSKVTSELKKRYPTAEVRVNFASAFRDKDDSLFYVFNTKTKLREIMELSTFDLNGEKHQVDEYALHSYKVDSADGKMTLLRHTPTSYNWFHYNSGVSDGFSGIFIRKTQPFLAKPLTPENKAKDEQFKQLMKKECMPLMAKTGVNSFEQFKIFLNKRIESSKRGGIYGDGSLSHKVCNTPYCYALLGKVKKSSMDEQIKYYLNSFRGAEYLCEFLTGKHGNKYREYVYELDVDGDGKPDYPFFYGGGYAIAFLNDEKPFIMPWPDDLISCRFMGDWYESFEKDWPKEQKCIASQKKKLLEKFE